ncbi:MAG: hypothetical protein JRI23_33205 [Deltaproteobacteria bacterium]|jgi:hypothetical protein|nr:hypothetical protein [Deltaproteobacteria bacterium]MBW2537130.1 hypothetical protein [Deltaproteobacteria bacterium]
MSSIARPTRNRLLATSAVAALALCLSVGCGEVYVEGFGDGGEGGTGATGGTAGTGGTGATGGTGGTAGSGGTGGQDLCSPYLDEEPAGQVTVRFVNQSGLPIYLPAMCGNPIFELRPFNGDDGIDYAFDPFCLQTCEDLQTSGIIDCAMCEPSSILLPAGQSYDVVWDGTGLEPNLMPDACWAMPGEYGGNCPKIVRAASQAYRIMAKGYETCGDGDFPCACDNTGYCTGDATGMEAWADITDFDYSPAAMLVEVVFGVCAFPCPSS